MNKSSVRRALTTLKKNGVIDEGFFIIEGDIELVIKVPFELTHPKKRTLKTKKVPKIKQVTGASEELEDPTGNRRITVYDIPSFEQESDTVKINII